MRTLALLGQRMRRDGLQLTLWVIGTALLALAAYAGVQSTYGTEQDRTGILAAAIANPVILLFRGLPSGAGEAAFATFLILPFLAMLAAFMSSFLAVRHTRMDEEAGRTELVAATPAGRTLPSVATLIHGVLANLVLAALVAAVFAGTVGGVEGSLLVGAAAGSVGLVFLGVGMLSAQLMRTSRGANSVAVTVMLVTFLFAGIGNAIGTPSDDLQHMRSSWLTWLSPFGWAENTRAFDENAWWPLALCLGSTAILVGLSLALQSVRDIGSSFVPERHGRSAASGALASSTALVVRLTRSAIIGWAIGALLTGMLSTTLAGVVEQIGGENPAIENTIKEIAGGGSVQEGVLTTFFTLIGILAACCAVQTVIRARQEEAAGTAELLLATPVGRVRWIADYVFVGLGAVVAIVAAGVAGAAIGAASSDSGPTLVGDAAVAGAGQVAAASVFLVLATLIFVLAPRLTIALGWTIVLLGTIVGLFGPLFGLTEGVTRLSPFAVTPSVADGLVDLRGLWWLVAITVAGAAAALILARRRPLASGG